MKDIDTLLIPMYINKTLHKVRVSLKDIEEKHPNRKDLIDSHKETIQDLTYVLRYVRELDLENRVLNKDLFNYQNACLDLKVKNNTLEKENNNFREHIKID